MKKLLLATLLSAVGMTATANDLNAYNLVGISYDNTTIMSSENIILLNESTSTWGFNGFGFEYTHGFGITDNPMFIEVGGKFSFLFNNRKENNRDYENKLSTSFVRLNIPVSYAYQFDLGNEFSLIPYGGFDFRFNLAGSSKRKNVDKVDHSIDKKTLNWFNKDDASELIFDEDYGPTWSRFQFGWHIGVRCQYDRYFASLNYGTDFNPLFRYNQWYEVNNIDYFYFQKVNWHTGNFALTLGYCF